MNMNTNLSIPLSEAEAEQLAELGLRGMLVSFPSHDETTFSRITGNNKGYRNVLSNLDRICEYGISADMNMVIVPENFTQVYDTGKFLFETFGLKRFGATPMTPVTPFQLRISSEKEKVLFTFDQLLKLQTDFPLITPFSFMSMPLCIAGETNFQRYEPLIGQCPAGTEEVHVRIDGKVIACSLIDEPFGNILTEHLETVVSRMTQWHKTSSGPNSIVPAECTPCASVETCRGGCRATSASLYGDISSPHPYMGEPLKFTVLEGNNVNLVTGQQFSFSEGLKLYFSNGQHYLETPSKHLLFTPSEAALYSLFEQSAQKGTIDPESICRTNGLAKKKVSYFLETLLGAGAIKRLAPAYGGLHETKTT
jgi:radical SAM protein with 4Fe4S-binding SPASM domain